ncbi:MAG: hypothetical protein ACI84K_000244 [Pseudohongiellaceae bacterium]|jgi:hypothetical protein
MELKKWFYPKVSYFYLVLIDHNTESQMSDNKFRLITRSDFDGLVCAVLLKHLDIIDEIKFVHPKDMQDGK